MAVTVASLKGYLRISDSAAEEISDEELTGYLAAAKSETRAAGIPDYKNNALYDHYLRMLVARYCDDRGLGFLVDNQANAEEAARRLKNSFTLALRHAGEDPEMPEAE